MSLKTSGVVARGSGGLDPSRDFFNVPLIPLHPFVKTRPSSNTKLAKLLLKTVDVLLPFHSDGCIFGLHSE